MHHFFICHSAVPNFRANTPLSFKCFLHTWSNQYAINAKGANFDTKWHTLTPNGKFQALEMPEILCLDPREWVRLIVYVSLDKSTSNPFRPHSLDLRHHWTSWYLGGEYHQFHTMVWLPPWYDQFHGKVWFASMVWPVPAHNWFCSRAKHSLWWDIKNGKRWLIVRAR